MRSRRPSRARRVRILWLVLACASAAVSIPPRDAAAEPGRPIDLVGAWHVTIHYLDEASEDPAQERWDDRVWRFEQRGSRLEWTEFPIVVFENRDGRFETADDGRQRRLLGYWTPNAAQLAQIARGLAVNPRGSRSKGLRGSPQAGYRSADGLRSESVGVIGYSESWTIEHLEDLPVFTQDAAMGSAQSEDVEGRTRYTTESVSQDGRELRGRFERDGIRHGTFVLRRSGSPSVIGGSAGGSG